MWLSRSGPLALRPFHSVTLHPSNGTWHRHCCDCSGAASNLLGEGFVHIPLFQPRDSTQSPPGGSERLGAHQADLGLPGCLPADPGVPMPWSQLWPRVSLVAFPGLSQDRESSHPGHKGGWEATSGPQGSFPGQQQLRLELWAPQAELGALG